MWCGDLAAAAGGREREVEGMAARKKKKENRIKDEKKRLKEIFAELEENKRNLVTPLIEKAAFMSIELDDLQETIASTRTVKTSTARKKAQRQRHT